jgi:type IV secretory pathway TraG/TraD family ATPase VirD4
MALDPAPDPDLAARLDWIKQVRGLHRTMRMIGFAGIMLGAGILLWWRFDAQAPAWAFWTGIGVLIGSWAVFIYVIVARWLWVRNNPYRGP